MFSSKLRVAFIALLILGGRCHATGQDAVSAQNNSQDQSIVSGVQAKLFSDSVLKTLDIRVFCKDGAVTLAGTVETDLERAAVERIARQEPGVTDVLNNLAVVKSPDGAADTTDAAPVADSATSPNNAAPNSNADANNTTPAVSTAAPAHAITLPSGTPLTVRMIDDVDSATTKVGDAFHASLENALVVSEVIVAPKGADVYGKLVRVKPNGKIAGAGKLTLELTGIQVRGQLIAIDSETYEVVGKGRGKQSAGTIGGGAATGAAIGGIAGGGAGAAIGAAAGAGGGTLIQLLRHRDQLRVPSETLLEFKLQQAVDIPAVAPAPAVPAAADTPAAPAEPAVSTEPTPAEDPSPAGDGLIFVPIFTGDGKTFAPGFSAHGNFSKGDDRIVLDANGTAEFAFNVPAGETLTVAFGTPIGGFVNTVNTEISVNGEAIATIPGVPNGLGVKSPVRALVWRKVFEPGSYVLSFRSGGWGINFYGLWLSHPVMAESSRPARPTAPVGGHGNTEGGPDLIEDNFTTDTVLNASQWQTNTPLLAALAQAEDSGLVDPRLSFDASGMKMAGVSGTYQLTGIQSAASFSPPFTALVTVKGTIAHGNALGFYITNDDLSQGIRLEGNLNPGNGEYRGLWIAHGRAPGDDVYRQTSLNQWYTVVVSVDANGTGAVTISDARGAVLASRSGLPVGTGPFFVVLGQREGAPFTVGPNEAIWASVTVQATAVSAPLAKSAAPAITSESQCAGPGQPGISNGMHGVIHVRSGTGVFSQFSSINKRIIVPPGGSLDGTLNLEAENHGPDFAVAPVIWTPSWGDLSNSWRIVSPWVHPGRIPLTAKIQAVAPQVTGTYYIILAMAMETNGASVASATNWALGAPVWGDGNDVGQFGSKQIDEAQKYGCTINNGLSEKGYQLLYLPADAITIQVGAAPDDPPNAPTEARTSEKGDIHSVDFRNFLYHPACSDQKAIRVKDRRWRGGTDDSPEYFEVVDVKYGDLKGDGREEAVVLGACSGIANFQVGDVFVYSDETGAPQLLAEFSPPDWGKGEQDNGGDFQISEILVKNQQLTISFYAGGSHAGPEWVVTARFRWSGSRFERVGIDRKPFTGFSRQ